MRKRPPTEKDINTETRSVLLSLWLMSNFIRSAAQPSEAIEEETERSRKLYGWQVPKLDGRSSLRKALRSISGITVHTTVKGAGTGKRHIFQGGDIAFRSVGAVPNKENLRQALIRSRLSH